MRAVLTAALPCLTLVATAASSPSPPPGGEGRGEGGLAPAQTAAPFTDVTQSAGITFIHSNAATGDKLLPETMGGGVASLDYDGDGHPDLLFVDSAGRHTGGRGALLYRNDGTGRFQDVTDRSGLAAAVRTDPDDPYGTFYGMGAAAADYDGDGWIDLYLTAVGPNRLLRNRWGVFEDVTTEAGVGGGDVWSTGAAFVDADGDGHLDLVVANYLEWSPELDRAPETIAERTVDAAAGGTLLIYGLPQTYRGLHPFLFLNRGPSPNGVTFREIGEAAGLHVTRAGSGEPVAKALAVAPIDLEGDGRVDLFVANDTTRNLLFHNRGPGEDGLPRFEETGELFGLAYDPDGNTTGAMGVDWGHLHPGAAPGAGPGPDPGLSILVGNFADEATSLYRAQGDPTFFLDEAREAGLAAATRPALTFGLLLLDADLDGRLDLLQANGHVEPDIQQIDPAQRYRQPTQLFWNAGALGAAGTTGAIGTPGAPGPAEPRATLFTQPPPDPTGALARPLAGRGAAYADLDGDGDLDLVLTQIAGPPLLLRNDQKTSHHWLRVILKGSPPNPTALGAHLHLSAAGTLQHRLLQPARSYLSQVELPLTFGLGTTPRADHLTITWPTGHRQRLHDLPAGRTFVVHAP